MSDHLFKYVQARIFNKPLLISEPKARVIADYLENRFKIGDGFTRTEMRDDSVSPGGNMVFDEKAVITSHVNGVAVIPIVGTLVNRQGNMDAASGITSHRSIRSELITAANNPSVKQILLDIDSGGGEVEGNFDLGRLIRRINNEIKPVVAIANGDAFSGAFSLGVSAGKFLMTETGGVGSVGVIIQHIDFSESNQAMGIKITNIKFGENKDLFNSSNPLSEEAGAVLQKEVNRTGDLFVRHVAAMRGIDKELVINTQASLIFGQEAVSIKFVDGISSFDDLLEDMINSAESTEIKRMSNMFTNKKIKAEVEAETPVELNDDPVERAAEISSLCADAGMSNVSADFIRSDMSADDVKLKIDKETQIRQACILAGKTDRADDFIKHGAVLKDVQNTLISEAASEQENSEISSQESPEKMEEDLKIASRGNVIQADVKRRQEKAKTKGV